MKILVIMKRFGANKDMVMENFGRQIRLFEPLAKKHKIDFLCPDYVKKESKTIKRKGIKFTIKPFGIFSIFTFLSYLKILFIKGKYDLIMASTDPLIGIIGYYYSKKYNISLIYDLQDNFGSYATYKIPFIRYLDAKAIRNADAVITVSDSLNKYIKSFRIGPTYTIQNGINLDSFKKMSKEKARKKLRLPKGKLIIYVGEISRFKGVDLLIDAFKEVKKKFPNAHLLLSGRIVDVNIDKNNIIYKKYPKREEVIAALNAADVAVVPHKDDVFSRYCFPYKLAEYMAADLPIVATKVGDVSIILSKYKHLLCMPNKHDMADKLIYALRENLKPDYRDILKNLSWKKLSEKVEDIMIRLANQNG